MSKIEFLYTEGKVGDRNTKVPVRLEGKIVGTIKPVPGGWQYFPLHHKTGGEIMPRLQDVALSLQSELLPEDDRY